MRWSIVVALLVVACEGPAGPQGEQGDPGSDGAAGSTGPTGDAGPQGSGGTAPWLTQPGVAITVTSLAFSGANATVAFTLSDGSGAALDASGRLTEGTVATSFVLAQLAVGSDGSPGQYTAYTTELVTSGSGAMATQPQAESSGTLTAVDVSAGTYAYTFAAPLTNIDS